MIDIEKYYPGFITEGLERWNQQGGTAFGYREPSVVDADVLWFSRKFRGTPPENVLEIGCGENPLSYALAANGFTVTGIDVQKCYIPMGAEINYRFIRDNFNRHQFEHGYQNIISLSTVEHIGLGAYDEEVETDGDTTAMSRMYNLVNPGGYVYITVPVGKGSLVWFVDVSTHRLSGWRIYSEEDLKSRIIRNFKVVERVFFASGAFDQYKIGDEIHPRDAFTEHGILNTTAGRFEAPNATVLLVMSR